MTTRLWENPDRPLTDRLRAAADDGYFCPVAVSTALMREAADVIDEEGE